jgi:hypothetical protein
MLISKPLEMNIAVKLHPGKVFKKIKMLGNCIVEMEYLNNILVDNQSIEKAFKEIDQITQGRKVKKLVIMGDHTEITKTARNLMVEESKKRKNNIIAEAIVVHSFAQKLSATFYILFLAKIYPVQLFADKYHAEKWLENFS